MRRAWTLLVSSIAAAPLAYIMLSGAEGSARAQDTTAASSAGGDDGGAGNQGDGEADPAAQRAENSGKTPAPIVDAAAATPQQITEVDFKHGGHLKYGLNLSILQFGTRRPADEPGRLRDYRPHFDVLPPQLGFQFIYEPASSPWRLIKDDESSFQLMSWGMMLLARVDNVALSQGALSITAQLNFFANALGLGLGFDLYRGIPIQDNNGVAGNATAYTGLLASALARQGELTPENMFVVLTLGVEPIANLFSTTGGSK